VGWKASSQPCRLRCVVRGKVCVLGSLSHEAKNELHRQGRVSIEVGKFIMRKNENSCGKRGVPSGLPMNLPCLAVFTYQRKVLPISYAN
jgi:hypothetical protein